jgi:hypothetical protein
MSLRRILFLLIMDVCRVNTHNFKDSVLNFLFFINRKRFKLTSDIGSITEILNHTNQEPLKIKKNRLNLVPYDTFPKYFHIVNPIESKNKLLLVYNLQSNKKTFVIFL